MRYYPSLAAEDSCSLDIPMQAARSDVVEQCWTAGVVGDGRVELGGVEGGAVEQKSSKRLATRPFLFDSRHTKIRMRCLESSKHRLVCSGAGRQKEE